MKQLQFKKSEYQGQLTEKDFKKFKLSKDFKIVKTLDDLRKLPLNYVIAECIQKNIEFEQEGFLKQSLEKKNNYLMSIGVYQQLWYDPYRKQKNLRPSSKSFHNLYRPYKGESLKNKTLLVIRTGGLGDLLFIQPNLIYLKEKYPTCTIKISCGPQYHAMVKYWDCIDQVFSLPLSYHTYVTADYHAIFEGVIERCEQAKHINAYNLFSAWMGLDLPDEKLIPIQTPDKKIVEYLKDKFKQDFLLIQMKASSPVRTPRSEFWIKIINRLVEKGYNIILTDSPYMSDQIDKFILYLNKENQSKVYNFSGESKLISYTIALASLSKCNIATDSSLVHISESLKVPCVSFYGPFPPEIRLSTYKHVVSLTSNIECTPCFQHGSNSCKKAINDHPICYDSLDLNTIIKTIESKI